MEERREDMIQPGARSELTIGVMGTPPYMAPEQWQGRAGKEADIYSLGVILHELFCDKRPFDFSDAHPAARAELYKNAHINQSPPKTEELRSGLPSMLSDLMLRYLKKEPSERPDFLAIGRFLDQVSRECFHKPLRPEPRKEELDRQARLDQAWALVRLGLSCKFQGDLDKALSLWEDSLKTFRSLGDQAGMSACYNNMGAIFYSRGEYDRAMQMYEKSLAIMRRIGDPNQKVVAQTIATLKQKLSKMRKT